MIEKIEITQRFNFKRLNRHYECFTIDCVNRCAYYKISERGSGDKFLDESDLCDDSWIDILVDLRRNMTSEIHNFSPLQIDNFLDKYHRLDLFKDFESESFSYFEKIELIYVCNVIIYSSDGFEEYSFKNNFPSKWIEFGEILKELTGFDVLHLNHQRHLVTPLFFDVKKDGIYRDSNKLNLQTVEFGHYKTYPYDIPRPILMINFKDKTCTGYIDKKLSPDDEELILNLLEKYGVYLWIFKDYHKKSINHDPEDLDGYDWYLEMVFENNIIWHIFGYNEYPDTYVHLALEIIEITGWNLLGLDTISKDDIDLLKSYGNKILSKNG